MKWIRRRSSSTLHSTTPLMLWTPSIPNTHAAAAHHALISGQEKSRLAADSQALMLPESSTVAIQPKDATTLHPKSILTTFKEEPHAANSNEMLIAALDFFFREDDPSCIHAAASSSVDHNPLVYPPLHVVQREGSTVLDPLLNLALPVERDDEVKNTTTNPSMLHGPFWNSSFYI